MSEYYYLSSTTYAYVNAQTVPTSDIPAFCGSRANPGVKTAIGCIRYKDVNIISANLIRISAGVSGGIAILMISMAAFQIMTSAGEPKKMEDAKSLLTAAVSGILFITLSVLIMRMIGVDILGLF